MKKQIENLMAIYLRKRGWTVFYPDNERFQPMDSATVKGQELPEASIFYKPYITGTGMNLDIKASSYEFDYLGFAGKVMIKVNGKVIDGLGDAPVNPEKPFEFDPRELVVQYAEEGYGKKWDIVEAEKIIELLQKAGYTEIEVLTIPSDIY